MSANPFPASAPTFWETLKLMFFVGDRQSSLQEQGKPAARRKDRKKWKELQR